MRTAITEQARRSIDSARDALLASHGGASIVADEVVLALLVDLRHFCEARRIDFEGVNDLAGALFRRSGRAQ